MAYDAAENRRRYEANRISKVYDKRAADAKKYDAQAKGSFSDIRCNQGHKHSSGETAQACNDKAKKVHPETTRYNAMSDHEKKMQAKSDLERMRR